jgi:hypothetical protein
MAHLNFIVSPCVRCFRKIRYKIGTPIRVRTVANRRKLWVVCLTLFVVNIAATLCQI